MSLFFLTFMAWVTVEAADCGHQERWQEYLNISANRPVEVRQREGNQRQEDDPFDFKDTKSVALSKAPKEFPHEYSTLVFSCIDPRFRGEVTHFLKQLGLEDDYDESATPGSSLSVGGEHAVNQENLPGGVDGQKIGDMLINWRRGAAETIRASRALHHIHHIMLLDHLDCGAYKACLRPESYSEDCEQRIEKHRRGMEGAITAIRRVCEDQDRERGATGLYALPKVTIYTYLMEGVEGVPPQALIHNLGLTNRPN